jgi:hypothetical protein
MTILLVLLVVFLLLAFTGLAVFVTKLFIAGILVTALVGLLLGAAARRA